MVVNRIGGCFFSFAFFDLNNYFKLDVVSDDLSKLDETFNTAFVRSKV